MGDDTVSTPDGSHSDVGVEVEVYTVSLGFFGKIRKVKQLLKSTSKKKTFTMDSCLNKLTLRLDDITTTTPIKTARTSIKLK